MSKRPSRKRRAPGKTALPGHPALPKAKLALGKGWAANTVNTVIFRERGLFSLGRYQFAAFYAGKRVLRLVRRTLNSGKIESFNLRGRYELDDAHNCASLGYDADGTIHLAYDHHNSGLRYRRSKRPRSIAAWTGEVAMTGAHEDRLSYPGFVPMPKGGPLLFLYRDGKAASGALRVKTWSAKRKAWTDHPEPILSGAGQRPWTSSPYWNHPAVAPNGTLHLSFVWRTDFLGGERRVNNIDIDYAKSKDRGRSWMSSLDRPFRLPITQVNSETVWPVSPGSNLINQCSMALDSKGRPHVVFYADDAGGIPQYQHINFDGKVWRHRVVSARTRPFALKGAGTLRIPISRPEIVIDGKDRVYVIYRGDLSRDRMVAQRLLPGDYHPCPDGVRVLWDEPLGRAEPVIDRERWERDETLSMLIQKNDQTGRDRGNGKPKFETVYIADWELPRLWDDRA